MTITPIKFETPSVAKETKNLNFKGVKNLTPQNSEKIKAATLQIGATAMAAITAAGILKNNDNGLTPFVKLDYSSIDNVEGEMSANGRSKIVKDKAGNIIRKYDRDWNRTIAFVTDYYPNGRIHETARNYPDENVIIVESFDKEGHKTKLAGFQNGILTSETSFNHNGKRCEKRSYLTDGKTVNSIEFYDEKDLTKKIITYFSDGKTINKIDQRINGHPYKETYYKQDGNIVQTCDYDCGGAKAKESFYYPDGKTIESIFENDAKNKPTKASFFRENGSLLAVEEYKNGNVIETTYREDGTRDYVTTNNDKRVYYENDGETISEIWDRNHHGSIK